MQVAEVESSPSPGASTVATSLLIVGPQPPPIGGAPQTLQDMLDELARRQDVRVTVINTSPSSDVREKMTGIKVEKVRRLVSILPRYLREVRRCDVALVFANNLFALTMVPLLLFLTRVFGKRLFVKPVGGDLDIYLAALPWPLRNLLLGSLRRADGILAQTQLLRADLARLGCDNAYYLPGCRTATEVPSAPEGDPSVLRLVFLSHIHRDKGPLVLLDALRQLPPLPGVTVTCDFYGPVHAAIRDEFLHGLGATPGARYVGVVAPGDGPRVIAKYDALALPTFFACEGHPGVLIEAMHAGVPVISTWHRAVPELVTDGVTGLLVPPADCQALAQAIHRLASDRALVERMAQASRERGRQYETKVVVDGMLGILFAAAEPAASLARGN